MEVNKQEVLFTPVELGFINFVLLNVLESQPARALGGETVEVLKARQYEPLKELPLAISISQKLEACTEGEKKVFVESTPMFTTEEKTKLLAYINRPWSLEDGKVYLSVKSKLE